MVKIKKKYKNVSRPMRNRENIERDRERGNEKRICIEKKKRGYRV